MTFLVNNSTITDPCTSPWASCPSHLRVIQRSVCWTCGLVLGVFWVYHWVNQSECHLSVRVPPHTTLPLHSAVMLRTYEFIDLSVWITLDSVQCINPTSLNTHILGRVPLRLCSLPRLWQEPAGTVSTRTTTEPTPSLSSWFHVIVKEQSYWAPVECCSNRSSPRFSSCPRPLRRVFRQRTGSRFFVHLQLSCWTRYLLLVTAWL